MNEIKILKKVMQANDQIADAFRKALDEKNVFCVNLMSSPGSGKTSIIERTVETVKDISFAVVEGDIETQLDAQRFNRFNIPVVSINTGPFGGDCHLEAAWIKQATEDMDLTKVDVLFVENIGNLVCPAEFDTGAHKNIVVLSLPEGEDKPLKYPLAFSKADLVLVNKLDLLGVLDTDKDKIVENIKKVNPNCKIIMISAKNSQGFDEWINWLKENGGRK